MIYLLDTSALIRWLDGGSHLRTTTRALIEDRTHTILVSDVSWWEIAVQHRSGKLALDLDEGKRVCEEAGLTPLALAFAHIRRLITLPLHHKDPFDHLLIAQAAVERVPIITSDHAFADYPIEVISA